MPILSSQDVELEIVQDLSDLEYIVPREATSIIEEKEFVGTINSRVCKQLNRAGGTTRNAARTLVSIMDNAKDNVRLNAALKILELHGAQFHTAVPQQTLQVVVTSERVNVGNIFNPRRT
jgi:hypothetical protein